MNENNKYLILNILISGFIGIIVGLVEIALPFMDFNSIITILLNAFIGIIIGSSIKNFFIFAYHRMRSEYVFIGSGLILLSIAMIRPLFLHYMYGMPVFTAYTFILISIAEILGMSWTYFSYRTFKCINLKLLDKKKTLSMKYK